MSIREWKKNLTHHLWSQKKNWIKAKVKVVAAVWGTEIIQFLVALAIVH